MAQYVLFCISNGLLTCALFAFVSYKWSKGERYRLIHSLVSAAGVVISSAFTTFAFLSIGGDGQSDASMFGEHPWTEILVVFVTSAFAGFGFYFLMIKIRERLDEGPPYFSIGENRIIPVSNRIVGIFAIWLLMILITSGMWSLVLGRDLQVAESFLWSWSANAAFFTIVGLAVSLAGIRLPHEEDFDSRLSILFHGNKSPAISSMRDRVSALGFYVEEHRTIVELQEFDEDQSAYKTGVTSLYTLRNLFGDVDAKDSMGFHFKPDTFNGNPPKAIGEFTYLEVDSGDQEESRLNQPMTIGPNGVEFDKEFKVGSEPVKVTVKYWAWVEADQMWDHEPKRFTDRIDVKVINQVSNIGSSIVPVRVINDATGLGDVSMLPFGASCHAAVDVHSDQGQRVKIIMLGKPEEAVQS